MEDTLQSKTKTQDINIDPLEKDIPTSPEDLDSQWVRWKCLNCGYVYEGVSDVRKCPKCGNENPDTLVDVA